MGNLQFYIGDTHYCLVFEYDYDANGHPWEVAAYIRTQQAFGWATLANVGIATIRQESEAAQERTRARLHDAINSLNLRPVLRKQMMRAANKATSAVAFNKETGRKLALARLLKLLGWSRTDRMKVWECYFNRFIRPARTIAASVAADSARCQSVSRREAEEIEAVLERMAVEDEVRAEEAVWDEWEHSRRY